MEMKKIAALLMAVTAGIVLARCSSSEQVKSQDAQFQAVDKAALYCSGEVERRSKGLSGTNKFTSIFWHHDGTYETTPQGTQSHESVTGIPYFESSALDMGNPGSAWRSCMKKRNINI